MARSRRFLDDVVYSEEHRHWLPELYVRIGHRIDVADRDWTEFCHHCKEPLAIIEQVRDVGQDITDKATTVTRKLAERADVPAFLMAWTVERPPEVQAEIDALAARVMALQTAYPIIRFRVLQIHPPGSRRQAQIVEPRDYWRHVLLLHRDHHRLCSRAAVNGEIPVDGQRLDDAKGKSRIWLPIQRSMRYGE